MPNIAPAERILADATTSTGGLGKIGTVAAAATLYVRCDNTGFGATDHIGWRVKCNKAHTVTLYRASGIVNAPTITLASAQANDTVIVNGLTYTAHASTTTVASRQFSIGGDDTADAAALVTCLNDATYGVPGVTATSALGVVTLTATTATTTQCVTGVGGARVVCAQTLPANLVKDTSYSGIADNSTTAGTFYEQWVDGWAQAYLAVKNDDSSNAATITVAATRY